MSGVKCEAAVHQRFRTCPVFDGGDLAALSQGYMLPCAAHVHVSIALIRVLSHGFRIATGLPSRSVGGVRNVGEMSGATVEAILDTDTCLQ